MSKHRTRALGRLFQLAALIVLPLSMLLELSGALGRSFGLSQMVLMLLFGICAFLLGRVIEGVGTSAE